MLVAELQSMQARCNVDNFLMSRERVVLDTMLSWDLSFVVFVS